jgi:hypothetical protein
MKEGLLQNMTQLSCFAGRRRPPGPDPGMAHSAGSALNSRPPVAAAGLATPA